MTNIDELPTRDAHPTYRRIVQGYSATVRRVAELEDELRHAQLALDRAIERADAAPVDAAVGDITEEEAAELRDAAEHAADRVREIENDLTVQRQAVSALKNRIQQAKVDIGRELSPVWQEAYRQRFDAVAEKFIQVELELNERAEFEDTGRSQGADICRFGRTALQHFPGLGPYGGLSVRGWVDAIREQHKYLG